MNRQMHYHGPKLVRWMYMDLSMKEEEKAKRVRGAVALGQHDDRVRAVICIAGGRSRNS